MRWTVFLLFNLILSIFACSSDGPQQAGEDNNNGMVQLGAYEGERVSSTHLVRVKSPWLKSQYLSINFPEHCWGTGLPNVSHMSDEAITTPWSYNADSTKAELVEHPRPGVTYRSIIEADSMAARLEMVLENKSDSAITDIRAMVCTRPDAMAAFHFSTYTLIYVWVDGKETNIEYGTTYVGDMPIEHVAWGLNVKGGPDNNKFNDLGLFRPPRGPGRIVDERAWPPLIAARHLENPDLWIATIWLPSRMVFSNVALPCIHSDPYLPHCPPGETVRARGLVLFHEGTLEGLLERVRREMEIAD